MNYEQLMQKRDKYQAIRGQIPEYTLHTFEQAFEIEYTHNSTAIEGNTLTLIETKVLLEDGISIGGKHELERISRLSPLEISPEQYTRSTHSRQIIAKPTAQKRATFTHSPSKGSPRTLLADLANGGPQLRQTYSTGTRSPIDFGFTTFQAAETISSGMMFVKH